jgi:hypothetical protein
MIFFSLGTNFFRKRLLQLLRTMLTYDEKYLAVAVLHPFYRRLTLTTPYSKTIEYTCIRGQINDILGCCRYQSATFSESFKKKHKSKEHQFTDPDDIDDIVGISLVPTAASINDELDRYSEMNIEDIYKQSNPLPFSKDNQTKFPLLLLLARHRLSIPVTSAGVERPFSAASLVLAERRCSLDPNTVNDVLFIRSI